jgi:hypothetical protein
MATFAGGQTYDPGSAGKVKMPNVPPFFEAKPQAINYPNWAMFGQTAGGAPDPFDFYRMQNQALGVQRAAYPGLVQMQLGMMPQITAAQLAASQQAFPLQLQQAQQASQSAFEEQMRQYGVAAPQIAAQNMQLMQQYAPQYGDILRQQGQLTADQLQRQAQQYNPEFFATYGALGKRIGEGLEAGYELGTDLEREVQQGIRASQTARGNYLGPAATAEEAFGKGQAALNLYNTRLGQAQGFLQGRAPTDLWGGMMGQYGPAGTAMGQVGQTAQPGLGYMSQMAQGTAGLAGQAAANFLQNPYTDVTQQALGQYGTYMGALGQWGQTSIQGQLGYNQNLIQAADVNNTGQYNMYDKQFEQFLFDQSVAQGLYSQPSTGGAGGMGVAGAAIGAVGTAAAGAAAAICWLARAVIPNRWKEFREFLFTKAPLWFRRKYIYSARRLANGLTKQDKKDIRETMLKILG